LSESSENVNVPKIDFHITPAFGKGERLDVFLSRQIRAYTRAQFQRFIDKERVRVNGALKKPSYKLRERDWIEADVEIPEPEEMRAENIPLRILYADKHIVVIDKASGMIVHPGVGASHGTLAHALLFHFPEIRSIGPEERPGIVHRLDKETSGVMVIARSQQAYFDLKAQFKKREVKKVYLGLAWGKMPEPDGTMDWPIGRHFKHGQRMSIKTRSPRVAETRYRVLREFKDSSLLEIHPLTGRTHQIRVHLSASGHPLIGDGRYGSRKSRRGSSRLFLHAHRLGFRHPDTAAWIEFCSPLPDDLDSLLKSIE
jgi:23S rRNA pseudouridine1911/1915/1917 synthase